MSYYHLKTQSNTMDVEVEITLDKFKLRDYQIPIWDAIENKGYRKVLAVLPRRAGKILRPGT